MNYFSTVNFETLLDVVTFSAATFMGLFVYVRNKKSWTHRFFFLLAIIIDIYIIVNYLSLHPPENTPENQLFWIRIVMLTTSLIGPLLVMLVSTFPGEKLVMKKKYIISLMMLMIASVIASITPLVFSSIEYPGGSPTPIPGRGIIIFFLDFVGLFVFSFIILIHKFRKSSGEERQQHRDLLFGVIFSFSLMAITTVIFVAIFKTSVAVFLGPVSTVILMSFIAYAIVKHHLFNVKVIATEAAVLIIWIILFSKIFAANTTQEAVLDSLIFLVLIPFGVILIRSVVKDVQIARQQYEMVATVSHQLRTPLTPIIGIASMILDGDFDKSVTKKREAEEKIFIAGKRLANVINDFLQVFELEGDRKFDKESFDVVATIKEAIENVKAGYESKGLYLRFKNFSKSKPKIHGEPRLFMQAISNLLDNAEKYTLKGGTTLTLQASKRGFIILVADTGIGLNDDAKQRMFQKFFRSEAARKIRPDGSGLGLPIVKKIIEAHGGKISVDSPGPDKGTTFTITFHNP